MRSSYGIRGRSGLNGRSEAEVLRLMDESAHKLRRYDVVSQGHGVLDSLSQRPVLGVAKELVLGRALQGR